MDYEACFEALGGANTVFALTGAGISTLSGIPDFRGKNGVFTRQSTFEGHSAKELLELSFFRRHPEIFYRYARECWYPMLDAAPSIGHRTLAKMEARHLLQRVYTQNIDLLHTKAGSNRVGELHGSFGRHHCLGCGKAFALAEIRQIVEAGQLPRCQTCGNLIKPAVVFYGENLDEALLEGAFADMEKADMLLVLGSSLTVAPVSGLPRSALRNHGQLVIVNDGPTPYDRSAVFTFADIAEFCQKMQQHFHLT